MVTVHRMRLPLKAYGSKNISAFRFYEGLQEVRKSGDPVKIKAYIDEHYDVNSALLDIDSQIKRYLNTEYSYSKISTNMPKEWLYANGEINNLGSKLSAYCAYVPSPNNAKHYLLVDFGNTQYAFQLAFGELHRAFLWIVSVDPGKVHIEDLELCKGQI